MTKTQIKLVIIGQNFSSLFHTLTDNFADSIRLQVEITELANEQQQAQQQPASEAELEPAAE
jgi:hypothetical protein